MTSESRTRFTAIDYALFIGSLVLSISIGIYYAFTSRKQQTTKEIMLANKSLGIVPVALTLSATFISAVSLLGYPAEIYNFGTMFCYYGIMYFFAYPIAAYVFLPVFHGLNITSCYEYLELRFSRLVRFAASAVFVFQVMLYMAVVLYAPSLALNSVTYLSIEFSIVVTGLVATFYTSIGGAKAVVWTNSFQFLLIVTGLLAVCISGAVKFGGMGEVMAVAQRGGRIQFNDFRLDPRVRHSFWSLMIGGTFTILTMFAANQMSVQRYLSMKNLRSAQIALLTNIPLNLVALTLYSLCGLIVYASYQNCDPIKAGKITRPDQLLAYYVMEKLGYIVGLPGLFVTALYGAGLSTLAGGFNALATVIITDFIKPIYLLTKGQALSDRVAANGSKVIACILGLITIGVAFVFTYLGSTVLQMALSIFGMAGGPLLGVFILGMLFPCSNWKGAIVGLLSAVVVTFWVGMSAVFYGVRAVPLPLRDDGCEANETWTWNTTTAASLPSSIGLMTSMRNDSLSEVFKISYQYYSVIGVAVVLLVGLIVSALTGFNNDRHVDPKLFIPVYRKCCCCLPARVRNWFKCGVTYEMESTNTNRADESSEVLLDQMKLFLPEDRSSKRT